MSRAESARRLAVASLAGAGLAAVLAGAARATWSIVAVDPETGEVGGAIASCVDLPSRYYGDDGVLRNVVLVPGVAAGVTQAQVNLDAADRMRADLQAGMSASETIDDVSAGSFDADAAERQHGVVRLDGPSAPAAFTGEQTLAWAGHETADGVSVQGNILVSGKVVAETLSAYRGSQESTLAGRLLDGLLAGSTAGGDSRCGPEQTALFAQVAVTTRSGALGVRTARVEEGDGRNPVELLAAGEQSGPPASFGPSWWGVVAGMTLGIVVVGGLVVLMRRRRSRRASS